VKTGEKAKMTISEENDPVISSYPAWRKESQCRRQWQPASCASKLVVSAAKAKIGQLTAVTPGNLKVASRRAKAKCGENRDSSNQLKSGEEMKLASRQPVRQSQPLSKKSYPVAGGG